MKQSVSPVLAGVIVAGVLAVVLWFGYRSLVPQKGPPVSREKMMEMMRPPADVSHGNRPSVPWKRGGQ